VEVKEGEQGIIFLVSQKGEGGLNVKGESLLVRKAGGSPDKVTIWHSCVQMQVGLYEGT